MSEMNSDPVWSVDEQAAHGLQGLISVRTWPIVFLLAMLGLIALGLPMVYSASVHAHGAKLFWQQVSWLMIGLLAALVMAFVPMKYIQRYSFWGLVLVGGLLLYLALASVAVKINPEALAYFPFTVQIKGAIRWLRFSLGGQKIQIQPSEFAKVLLLIYLSSYYGSLPREQIKKFKQGFLIPSVVTGVILMLILLGKDLSTTVITGLGCFAVMFFAGVRVKYLLLIVLCGLALGTTAVLISPERVSRVTSYQNPEADQLGDAFQLWRSQLGMGGGGLSGRGFSRGVIKTFLPEAHTDFIVAVIGEELGFLGVALVVLLYLAMFTSIIFIARQCRDRPGMLLCLGIGVMITLQALINIGVVSGWCPTTGITAPFLSYGGSSLMILLVCCGLIINISLHNLLVFWHEMVNTPYHLTYKGAEAVKRNKG
ncbi:MAG: FtsW/RodA/SpoVE family cell cycle protein [Lentisphaerae bacterium]|jgi:cell division protein FtsW|nr:FtsW/RodA/SpoVE family cell cycle protein [Lentisphaerota bacterium]